ncbi:RNA polymerase sigma factor [Aestuariibaculum suncheonense]|uniref:Sigma-70 family RNA polymerase sigma factor n=1 Tax=Aestuariibaculum suncheonense TaxID=1028745 RepID=A0A8J6Q7P8_9FLAO|nr:sigma-70 family RNA polymerase sigma factor [Aestuariibaculum suncheonense]MBD0835406.1 sigma-70 family RNA polymerase sigma factor [Aestuariibaculum suncheonense]
MAYFKETSDKELFSLIKNGDHKAYTELYNRYSPVLYAHILRRLNDREEAKDIIHELFSYIWVNRLKIEIEGHLSGYLYTAVRNRVIKVISRRIVATKHVDMHRPSPYNNIASDYLIRENQLRDLIEKEIELLPPRMQEIFLLSRKKFLTHREIAYELNISELTVKKQVANAIKVLRTKLDLIVNVFFFVFFL